MRKYDVPNTNWSMFYETTDSLPEIIKDALYSAIFDHLANVTKSIFPSLIEEKISIVFAPFIESPVSFPENSLIFLHKQSPNDTAQTIYQLGHELLHTYYKSPLNTPMFWFEEVVCEVSSHLFLQAFAKDWYNSKNSLVRGFIESTLNYSDSQLQENEFVDLKQLPLDYLKDNPTGNRKLNTYIALFMLPIFKKRPDFLVECRKLSTIYTETDLMNFFEKAYNVISPNYHLELRELERLFI